MARKKVIEDQYWNTDYKHHNDSLLGLLEMQEEFSRRLAIKYKAKVTKLEKEVKKLKACECDNCRIKRNLDKQIKVRTDGLQL